MTRTLSTPDIKERPILMHARSIKGILAGSKTQTRRIVKYRAYAEEGAIVHPRECPYGQPGDRLWVRETWRMNEPPSGLIFKADLHPVDYERYAPWRPSIYMPRWASRLTLEITDIRVERVQDISEEDARAEGLHADSIDSALSLCENFSVLWEETNGKGAWERNDWVWVISFRRLP